MKIRNIATPAIVALFTCFGSGCVTYTTYKDEPRQNVHFASPKAAESFYETYLATYYPVAKDRHLLVCSVSLPYMQQKRSTDNIFFNAAVQAADTNSDGIVSDEEAAAYASKAHKNRS
jgi:hypothetical protein